jgi:hypothetical protein
VKKHPAVLGAWSADEIVAMVCGVHKNEADFADFCAEAEGT